MPTSRPTLAVATLANALEDFLTTSDLPEPCYVGLNMTAGGLDIQPRVALDTDPATVLGTLLLFSRPLDTITVTWWRTASDDLHVSITGRLPHGIGVRVYTSVPYDTVREWVLLNLDSEETVSRDTLARLVEALPAVRPAG